MEIFIVPITLAILYSLYEAGIIAFRSKHSLYFSGVPNGSYADFTICTGKITCIMRFRENRKYTILFDKSIEKGSIHLSIYDKADNALVESFEGDAYTFSPEPGKRYKMCIRMKRATGTYRIKIR